MIAQALGEVGWPGYGEGHIFDLLVKLVQCCEYKIHEDPLLIGRSDRAVDNFPLSQLTAGFLQYFEDFFYQRFGPSWTDKTPGPEAIKIVPVLLRLFPRAKFIFCQRRGLDVVLSASRRFNNEVSTLYQSCDQWVDCMLTWADLPPLVRSASFVVEHRYLVDSPSQTAAKLADFLNLDKALAEILCKSFFNHPEQTQFEYHPAKLSELDWPEELKAYFVEKAGFAMTAFGYGMEHPFIGKAEAKPIHFSKDPRNVDLSSDLTLYKYLGINRFLLHPGPDFDFPTAIRFKKLEIGAARYLAASASVENHQSAEIMCGMQILTDYDQVLAECMTTCVWRREAMMSIEIPESHPIVDVVVWSKMADPRFSNNYAWCNIVNLRLI